MTFGQFDEQGKAPFTLPTGTTDRILHKKVVPVTLEFNWMFVEVSLQIEEFAGMKVILGMGFTVMTTGTIEPGQPAADGVML